MLPKRNDKKTVVNVGIDQEQDHILNNPAQSEDGKMASFEDALDRRLKQQSEFLTDLFIIRSLLVLQDDERRAQRIRKESDFSEF